MRDNEQLHVGGFTAPGFEAVRDQFQTNLTEEVGAAFAATHDGVLVVDLWGGAKDQADGAAWGQRTLCPIFSGTKGLSATCILRLIERGSIDLDAPVVRYWPEFEAQGKRDVLVRHVMSHQAGLPGIRARVTYEELPDASRMAELLAAQAPFWPPGTRMWYHPLTFGWLCGELVRRVTGEAIGPYFQREIAEPLGIEAWIGLPADQEDRVATLVRAPGWRGVAADGPHGEISARDLNDVWRNPELFPSELPWNTRPYHAAEIPGANGIATARSLAVFYGSLVSERGPGQVGVLQDETVDLGQQELSRGFDPCDGEEMAFGVGWLLQTGERRMGPPGDAFGHDGAGGSQHGAWPEERVGFSYLMNLMRDDAGDHRAVDLLRVLHRCVRATSERSGR